MKNFLKISLAKDFPPKKLSLKLGSVIFPILLKPLLCPNFESQKPSPLTPKYLLCDRNYFSEGFSGSCFENQEIFGVKNVKIFFLDFF